MRPILKLPSYKLGTDQSLQLGVEFLTREKIHLPVVNCDWSLMQEKVVDIVDSFVVCVITTLDSCPWGPATAHGVGILTELYVIYMERDRSPYTYQKSGPLVYWRQQERWLRTDGRTESQTIDV